MAHRGDSAAQRFARELSSGSSASRTYTGGQVARALDIAETTLRSWHRRYEIGPQATRPGGYRRYTAEDISRLERMRDLIRSGMLASDAARTTTGPLAGPGLDVARDRLTAASRALDSRSCRNVLVEAIQAHGVVAAWENVCRPALADVEDEQRKASEPVTCVPREHVLSWSISAALHNTLHGVPQARRPAVLLTCVQDEQHTLPLEALGAALAERDVPVRMLGAAMPTRGLVAAVRASSPEAVVVWAQRPSTASGVVASLRRLSPRIVTAGPGWSARRRASPEHLSSLPAAVTLLSGEPTR
ncbi:MerR family transcriptional regulator [Actinophytocola sp. NPDC049390]|uniref:MerR family transcriptional regulator n=1 Tax=Actinophytocola sp. NPDC049390 TaxID=3363894 RepID=UPI00379ADB6E